MRMPPRLCCMLLVVAYFAIALWADSGVAHPNVILIMADDLGYRDLSCYGHAKIKTPVIDQLARDGVRLTSFYAGATVCTPSRMALLTGCYPSRLGWTKGVVGHIMPKGTGLAPEAVTIAELFRANGYRTAMVGKWHLGDEKPFRPHRQGFEQTFYINKSNNQTDEIYRDDDLLEKPFNNRLLTEKFTNEAIAFIRKNHRNPFLLYLPYSAPHFPVEAHPDWKEKSSFGAYGDVVEELDYRIGELLEALDELKLSNNTLVVFMSDNGPEPLTKESLATPLRGKKWSALEGGTRVPCIVRFPSRIPANQISGDLIAAIDVMPTLVAACGVDVSKVANPIDSLDGANVWDSLLAPKESNQLRRSLLYWHGADGFQAIRVGDWKLFPNGSHAGLKNSTGPALFHLSGDISERSNVIVAHADRAAEMQQLANEELKNIAKESIALGKVNR